MKTKPNISYTTRYHLCTGCGVCEGACPSHAISMQVKKGKFRPIVDEKSCKNSKGCHRCYETCPGIGIDLIGLARKNFQDKEIKQNKYAGTYLKCFTGHSKSYDIRFHCASGGMVSQFLIYLLEKGYIQGAVVTAFDKDAPLLVHSYIARTKEEVLAGKSSKYAPVTLNHVIQDIKSTEGKYVIVGLPCHIAGFRKYEQYDKKFKKLISGYFSIYCSSGRSFYLTEYVFKTRKIHKDQLDYFAYRDNGCLGNMVAKGKGFEHEERFQDYYQPLRSFFVPKRCTMCIDHYGELSDVSFGDIHIDPYIDDTIGVNSLIVRNRRFLNWLYEAKNEQAITLDEISVAMVNKGQVMAKIKKERNSTFIRINKILGKKVPWYDVLPKEGKQLKWFVSYLHTNIQQFIGSHKWMWWAIEIFKGKGAVR